MRLNRNSVIFIALLAVVIVVALIFLQDDSDDTDTPTVDATAETIQLFSGVAEANVIAVTVREIATADDSDATPAPDESEEIDTTPATIALMRDRGTGDWSLGDETTQAPDGMISSTQINTSVQALVSLLSNRQFTPSDGDYTQFGLDAPAYDITFMAVPPSGVNADDAASGDAEMYRLRVGNRTVGENSYYAFLNDDDETIYVVTNATTLQNSILNLATNPPLEPTPVPTTAPLLNTQAPFAEFVLTNATSFVFRNAEDATITVSRNADGTGWLYTDGDEILPVQQESLQVILNSFSTISGVERVTDPDLAALGLDAPAFNLQAQTVDGRTFVLQLGDQDPTGSFYYSLVDDFEDVVLIDSDSVLSLVDLFDNPPPLQAPEATPEVTAEAEATEAAD